MCSSDLDPDSRVQGIRSGALASTIDVPATILERARLAPCLGMQGMSLLGTLENGTAAARDSVLIQYDHQVGPSRPGRMLRTHGLVTRDWRMSIAEGVPGGELYNLQRDPDEFFNLWDDRAAVEDKCDLLARLARTEMETVDEMPLATGQEWSPWTNCLGPPAGREVEQLGAGDEGGRNHPGLISRAGAANRASAGPVYVKKRR